MYIEVLIIVTNVNNFMITLTEQTQYSHYSLLISQCSFSWIFNKCDYYVMEIISCSVKSKIHLMLMEVKRTTENKSQFAFIASISLCELKKVTLGEKQVPEGCSYKRPLDSGNDKCWEIFSFPSFTFSATFSPFSLSNVYVCPHPISPSDLL